MTKHSLLLRTAVVLICLFWPALSYGWVTYTGTSFVLQTSGGVSTGSVSVADSGFVASVTVNVNMTALWSGLPDISLNLVSPAGDSVALFNIDKLEGKSLHNTTFDDAAAKKIVDGDPPYIGPHSPMQSLNIFGGTELSGNWTLVAYQHDDFNPGMVESWSFSVQTEAVPAPTPPDPGREFRGNRFSLSNTRGTTTSDLFIAPEGMIERLSMSVNFKTFGDLENHSFSLRSPDGTTVNLFEQEDLYGTNLYRTFFCDLARQWIYDGQPAYSGSYRPKGIFSNFNSRWSSGTWTFIAYNDQANAPGEVINWSIFVHPDPGTTPTPSPAPPDDDTSNYTYEGELINWRAFHPDRNPVNTNGTYFGTVEIDSFIVGKVIATVSGSVTEDLDHVGIYLISPEGTEVALFEKYDIGEHGLYQTLFDDEAESPITQGKAPYIGSWQPVEKLSKFNGENASGDWKLAVYNDHNEQGGEFEWTLDFIPAPTPAKEKWHMAAGGTEIEGFDFSHYVLIANPGERDANVLVECVDENGVIDDLEIVAKARSRRTVNINNLVGNNRPAVSVIVTSTNQVPVYCERSSYWSPGGFHWAGSHASTGIRETSRNWYLAEGATHLFDQYIHVLNPHESSAMVEVVFADHNGATWRRETSISPRSNRTIKVNDIVGSRSQISTRVRSVNAVPVAVERTMYWNGNGVKWIDGHASRGASEAALSWYLAEGATHIFDEYIVIFNPDDSRTAQVRVTFLENGVAGSSHIVHISPMSRKTINAGDYAGSRTQIAATIESLNEVPVVAERAMYWTADGIPWAGGHATVGSDKTASRWFVPEGATHIFDHYIQILNPDHSRSSDTRLTFLLPDGSTVAHFVNIPPGSRRTVNAANVVGSVGQAAAVVESIDSVPLVVERAMYHPRGVWRTGHATVGIPFPGPEIPSWYALYGPEGDDRVVRMENLFVAKWEDNPGTDFGTTNNWQAARSYALNSEWLGKSDWRLPTRQELQTILRNQHLLGRISQGWHWSAEERDGQSAWVVSADGDLVEWAYKTNLLYFRLVRDAD